MGMGINQLEGDSLPLLMSPFLKPMGTVGDVEDSITVEDGELVALIDENRS